MPKGSAKGHKCSSLGEAGLETYMKRATVTLVPLDLGTDVICQR
jgi:hypothetical protein